MNKDKEPLFSVTANDCKWDYIRGSGAGGQHRNKTDSAVRCTHPPSKAVGYAEDTRSQHQNKRLAFERMAKSKEFQKRHKMEVARRTGKLEEIKHWVDKEMRTHIKVEIKDGKKWAEVDRNDPLSDSED